MSFIKKISDWEQWPFKVLYAPMTPVWLYYIIRSGAVWFFTPSNPKLTFGGFEGEPKREMHELLPEKYKAPYFNVLPSLPFASVLQQMKPNGIDFPLIVKPEVGSQGVLMRKIDNVEELEFYHNHVGVEYVVQAYVKYPMEVSLFYYRYPWEQKGNITGFLQKVPLQVTGDGVHTLKELILMNSKSKKRLESLKMKHGANFGMVLKEGEIYKLSVAGNHNRGANFIDLKDEINDSLRAMLDDISLSINDFFYGRYDILCDSIEELKEGKNFIILEYNGCGAEPNHFYDTGYSLRRAYLEIMMHWKKLFTISRYNHQQGCEYWSFRKGWRFLKDAKKYFRKIKQTDLEIP